MRHFQVLVTAAYESNALDACAARGCNFEKALDICLPKRHIWRSKPQYPSLIGHAFPQILVLTLRIIQAILAHLHIFATLPTQACSCDVNQTGPTRTWAIA